MNRFIAAASASLLFALPSMAKESEVKQREPEFKTAWLCSTGTQGADREPCAEAQNPTQAPAIRR